MDEFKFHAAANLFPLMGEPELAQLASDIKNHGLRVPVEIFEGQVIDGRNRVAACRLAGVEVDWFEVHPDDPVAYVLSLNLHRRHLNETQRAMVAARTLEYHKAAAKERMMAGKKRDPKASSPGEGAARDAAGEAVGVSGRSVDHAAKVLANGTKELQGACDRGEVAVSSAAKLATLSADEQDRVIQEGRDSGNVKKAVSKAISKAARHPGQPPDGSAVSQIEFQMTVAQLSVAEEALREEPYRRLPCLAGQLAVAGNVLERMRQQAIELKRVLHVAREACRENLTHASCKNEQVLYEAFKRCDESLKP